MPMRSQLRWNSPPGTRVPATRATSPPCLVRTLPPPPPAMLSTVSTRSGARDQLSPLPPQPCSLCQSPTAGTTPGSSQHHHPALPSCLLPVTVAPMAGPAGECPAVTQCLWAGVGILGPPQHHGCSATSLSGATSWTCRTAACETSPCSCPATSPARRRHPSPAFSGRSG